MAIHPDTSIGAVRLTVGDLERMREFYEQAIGLRTLESSDGRARLGADGSALVELVERPDATPRPPHSTGLYHLAVLVPTRGDLAQAARRVGEAGASFTGASDHLVSEALYLRDPEDNGIEIYRDRPREEWRYVDGSIQMASLPLDLDAVMAELASGASRNGVPPGTRIGHVHLQVADIGPAEEFYAGVLGFEVTVRAYPSALFLAADGYHHHIGFNTWESAGAPPPPPGARGLRAFEVVLPDADEMERVSERLAAAGIAPEPADGGLFVADPSGNPILLTTR
jgi:catechol 2,3-dioxygenase